VESSDEEYPNAGEDSSSSKGTPWYSRPGATEYRRPDIKEETAQAWDEQISESAETNTENIFAAVQKQNREAARHLIKNGFDMAVEAKRDLETLLDPDEESMFEGLRMLGGAYREYNNLGRQHLEWHRNERELQFQVPRVQ
jgi:hypothetical protein